MPIEELIKERTIGLIIKEDFAKLFPKVLQSQLMTDYITRKQRGENHYAIIGGFYREYFPNSVGEQ